VKVSPLVDTYLKARYTSSVQDAYKFKLIRKPFDVAGWVDTSFLDQVVAEEHLESYWPARPAL
jgi:sulfonate transport system substrate-binding protein